MNVLDYNLYGEFNIDLHRQKYPGYLEVIIDEDGNIEYAVPSHQEKLIANCMKKLNCTRQELADMCPKEYYCDFNIWLCMQCNCVSVWYDGINCYTINNKQIFTLRKLKMKGLYKGYIPKKSIQ